jgi:hypothetical protein
MAVCSKRLTPWRTLLSWDGWLAFGWGEITWVNRAGVTAICVLLINDVADKTTTWLGLA